MAALTPKSRALMLVVQEGGALGHQVCSSRVLDDEKQAGGAVKAGMDCCLERNARCL